MPTKYRELFDTARHVFQAAEPTPELEAVASALEKLLGRGAPQSKRCTICHKVKDLSEFYVHKRRINFDGKPRHRADCKQCTIARINCIQAKHLISTKDYRARYEACGGRCAICNKKNKHRGIENPSKAGYLAYDLASDKMLCAKCFGMVNYIRKEKIADQFAKFVGGK